jgi:hypothetical protein
MLKGTRRAVLKHIQPLSIHGQVSLDLHVTYEDEPDGQVRVARIGDEAVPRRLEPGDTIDIDYLLGVATAVRRVG